MRVHMHLGVVGAALLSVVGCSTTMQGQVTEEGTTTPVSGALVQVGEETVYTDWQGRYELDVEDEATLDVYVTAPAYEPHGQQLRVRDQDTLAMSFQLRPQPDRDEPTEVTVNASAAAEERTQAASSPKTDQGDAQQTVTLQGTIQSLGYLPNAEHSRSLWLELPARIIRVRMHDAVFDADWMNVGDAVEVTGDYRWIDGERVLIASQVEPYTP